MTIQRTQFGSLESFEKGGVEIIDDDPKRYAFSNVFEVASRSQPYEKVAVGKNLKYVIEAVRAEGTSPWFAAAHDEAALIMDGTIEVHFIKPDQPAVNAGTEGTVKLAGQPAGQTMGWVKCGRGHMALAAGRRRLPVPQPRQAGRPAGADDSRREHGRTLGRRVPGRRQPGRRRPGRRAPGSRVALGRRLHPHRHHTEPLMTIATTATTGATTTAGNAGDADGGNPGADG